MSSIGHKGLETVRITAYDVGSILTGTEILPILKSSPNLKTFVFDGLQTHQDVALSFAGQPQLSKVKLLNWKGPSSTIGSLINCKGLKELVIDYHAFSSNEIKAILLEEHPWDLQRLELKGLGPSNDGELNAITKRLRNLECLRVSLTEISEEGMEMLGINCPNLKTLQFSNRDLTDSGLDRLTQHLPNLETISFNLAYNITEEGVAAIARNCEKLRFIQIVHYKEIEKSGIDALAENCPDLKVVGFSYGGPISLDGMCHLVERRPQLRHVKLCSTDKILKKQIETFYLQFPQVSKFPYTSSAKKLHNLAV